MRISSWQSVVLTVVTLIWHSGAAVAEEGSITRVSKEPFARGAAALEQAIAAQAMATQ